MQMALSSKSTRQAEIADPSVDQQYVSKQLFKEGMARLAGAVNVITTDGPAGRAGFTATAVCSVCDTPPTLLVCVNNDSSVSAAFRENHALCVNTIGPKHRDVAMLFGGKTPTDERFAAADWHHGKTGAPVLEDALVAFDCTVSQTVVAGTHSVLFCAIKDILVSETTVASVYFSRRFYELDEENY